MSCRRVFAALAVAGWAWAAFAEERVPPPAECRDIDGRVVADMDCAEYLQHMEMQQKIEEVRGRIAEARQKRLQAERPPAPPPSPTPPPAQAAPPPAVAAMAEPPAPTEPDRVLDVTGNQARIRYKGATYLVVPGMAVSRGARVTAVSLDGVDLDEGGRRRRLPFLLGDYH